MHRLLVGIPLLGALLLCTCLAGGCGRREQAISPPGDYSAAADASPAQTANAAPPTADAPASQPAAEDQPVATRETSSGPKPMSNAAGVAAQAGAKPPEEDSAIADLNEVTESSNTTEPTAEASWSTQRLVLLAPGGPRVIDLRMNVQGNDLATGLADTTNWLADQLEFDFKAPITWDALLEKPLVKSGWFGNLVPTAEQRAELLAIYDKENIGTVDVSEFQAFLTRGLSRRDHVRLIQGPSAAPLVPSSASRSASPWGPLDQDDDGQLSMAELNQAADALMHFDFDGDRIVSERELRSTSEAMSDAGNMARTGGLIDLALVLAIDAKEPAALERAVLEHYTFADAIPREAFFGWEDHRWGQLDPGGDQEITKRELAALHDVAADAQVEVALPSSLGAEDDSSEATVTCQAAGSSDQVGPDQPAGQILWTKGPSGGRLLLPGCVVLVQVRDDHNWGVRRFVSQQFAQALDQPQLAAALAGSLELKEGAWDALREHGSEDTGRAWRWLVSSRHFHLSTRWTAIERPWFELIDANGDRRLTVLELSEFPAAAARWDRNLNGKLEEEEVPMVIALSLTREDSRLANFLPGGTNIEKRGASNASGPSWFAGMDYNLDGELTHAEFLGEKSAFDALDANGDGIIDVREAYAPH